MIHFVFVQLEPLTPVTYDYIAIWLVKYIYSVMYVYLYFAIH